MAKVIEFYIPQSFRKTGRPNPSPPPVQAKLIEFPKVAMKTA